MRRKPVEPSALSRIAPRVPRHGGQPRPAFPFVTDLMWLPGMEETAWRNSVLLVEDVPADSGNRPFASRPVGPDVGRMKEHCALKHGRLALIVDRFGHFPGTQPVLPRRGRQ